MITSIFKNDFYRRPPIPKWSWELSILANSEENWSEDDMRIFTQAITKIEIPELSMLTTQSQYRGLTFDIPTRLENNGEITLTFNENSEMELYKALKNQLYYTSYNDGYIIDEWSKKDDKGNFTDTYMLYYAPFDVYVSLRNPENDNEPTYHFFFHNCFISSIGEAEMTYDSEEVFEFPVKIHYNFRVEGLDAEEYYNKVKSSSEEKKVEIPAAPEDTNANAETGATEATTEEAVEKSAPAESISSTAETATNTEQSVKPTLTAEPITMTLKQPETTEEDTKTESDFGQSAQSTETESNDQSFNFDSVDIQADDDGISKSGTDLKWSKSLADDDAAMFSDNSDFKLPELEDLDDDTEQETKVPAQPKGIELDEQEVKADDDGQKKSGIDKQWHDGLSQEDSDMLDQEERSEVVKSGKDFEWSQDITDEDSEMMNEQMNRTGLPETVDEAEDEPEVKKTPQATEPTQEERTADEKKATLTAKALKAQQDEDDKNNVVRLSKSSLGLSKAEREKAEADYSKLGKRIIWED